MPAPSCSIPSGDFPAAKRRAKNAGLLLAYEKTGYDKTGPGRLGDLLDHWSARRLKEAGADCVKILLYYTPFDPKDVNDKKHAWVERIGDECRANDIPYFLEFVGYEEGADEKGLEYAKKKPHIVTESMREFSKDRYGVDVLKVEVPVNMKFVEGTKSFGGPKSLYQERGDRPVPRRLRMLPPSRSSIFRRASAMRSSARRWNWQANQA
jgi:tagatose 1,6-diphosphate aldolase